MASGQQTYVVQSRKAQPKQAKNFSPIKTALILDHYQNIESQIEAKSGEKRAKVLSKLQDKNRTVQQQHSPGLIQIVNLGPKDHIQLYRSITHGGSNKVSQNQAYRSQKKTDDILALGSVVSYDQYNQTIPRPSRFIENQQPYEKIYFSQPRPADKKYETESPNVGIRLVGTVQQKIKVVPKNKLNNKELLRTYYQQNSSNFFRQGSPQGNTKSHSQMNLNNQTQQEKYMMIKQHDEELASFQIEIERRFVNATTRNYHFPRIITLEDQSDTSMHGNEEDYFMDTQNQESLIKSLINKYQSLSSQKSKERFCDKIKNQKPKQLQISQSSKQLQVKSVEKILSEQQQLQTQLQGIIKLVQPVHPGQKAKVQQSQFFQHTHNRLNTNRKVDFKGNNHLGSMLSPTAGSSTILGTSSSSYFPSTTKNIQLKNESQMSSYFVVGNHNYDTQGIPIIKSDPQLKRIIKIEDESHKSSAMKKGKLDSILKLIGNSSNSQETNFTFLNMHGGMDKKFINYQQRLKGITPQLQSMPQSPKSNKRSLMDSSQKQISPSQEQSTPQQRIRLVTNKNNQPKTISQSYKKFKQQDSDQRQRLSQRSSRNHSQNSNQGTPNGKGNDSSRNRQLSQNSSKTKRETGLISINMLQQNAQRIPKSNARRKLKHVASILQVSGTPALKKDMFASLVSLVKSPQGKEIPTLGTSSLVHRYTTQSPPLSEIQS